jgi:hypothetical protein
MANNLQFTTPVSVPNLQKCKVGNVFVDEDGGRMQIEVIVSGGGGVLQRPNPWVLAITNGSADALVADAAATVVGLQIRSVQLGGAGVAAAFTTALAGYRGAGGDKRGALMTALQGITGVIQNPSSEVGALSGTTVPVLPAGTVS